jgi:spermidine synthase
MPSLPAGHSWSLELRRNSYAFLLGFMATSFQILILREFEASLFANELVYGLVLAFWLLGSSLGSWLIKKNISVRFSPESLYYPVLGLAVILLVWLRFFRLLSGYLPAEAAGFWPVLLISFLISIFLSFPLGALFVCNVHWLNGQLLTVYQLESLGSAAGGLAVYLFLIPYFSNWQAATIVIILIAVTIAALSSSRKARVAALPVLLLACLLWFFDFPSQKLAWQPFELVASKDSIYSRLQVIKSQEQFSFYTNNLLAFNYPDPQLAEESVCFSLLQRPEAKSILLLGGGLNGSLELLLTYPEARIDYVELDPEIIKLTRLYLPEASAILDHSRVTTRIEDGRRFIGQTNRRYELIISNLPEPSSAQINRFYTVEFFAVIKERLASDGVFSFVVPSSENYISDEQASLLATFYYSLKSVFSRVTVIPGDNNIFLASEGPVEDSDRTLSERWHQAGLNTTFFRPELLPGRLSPAKKQYLMDRIEKVKQPRLNHDSHPISYFFSALLWSKQFKGPELKVLSQLLKVKRFWLFDFPLLLVLLIMVVSSLRKKDRLVQYLLPLWLMGFTTMVTEIGLILAFQSKLGFIYGKISLLFTMFMFGLYSGSKLAQKFAARGSLKLLAVIQAGFVLLLAASQLAKSSEIEAVYYLLLLTMGVLGGAIFSVGNTLLLNWQTSYGLGYALDLFGSFLGALLASSVFIPLLGLDLLFLLLILLNSFGLLYLLVKDLA